MKRKRKLIQVRVILSFFLAFSFQHPDIADNVVLKYFLNSLKYSLNTT